MKKATLALALFSVLLLGSCGEINNSHSNDNSTEKDESASKISYKIIEKTFDPSNTSAVGGKLTVTHAPKQENNEKYLSFTIDLNEGYEVYFIKLNNKLLPKDTTRIDLVKDENIVNINYKKTGSNVAKITAVNYELKDEHITNNISNLSDTDEHRNILRDEYFNSLIFNTDKFEAENIYGLAKSNKDKKLHYVQVGGATTEGHIKVDLNSALYTYIEKIEAEVISYTSYIAQDPITHKPIKTFKQDSSMISLNGRNFKSIPFTSGTSIDDTESTTVVFDDFYCEGLNNKLNISNFIPEDKVDDVRNRFYLKELRFYTIL